MDTPQQHQVPGVLDHPHGAEHGGHPEPGHLHGHRGEDGAAGRGRHPRHGDPGPVRWQGGVWQGRLLLQHQQGLFINDSINPSHCIVFALCTVY